MNYLEAARIKITEECEGRNDLYKIEEHLSSICTTEAVAKKLLEEKKTIKECFEYIKNKAYKQAVDGCACIPYDEVFKMAEEYYGLLDTDKGVIKTNMEVISLEDFL